MICQQPGSQPVAYSSIHIDTNIVCAPQVHVFETTIRVLGGLLSGHVLLDADPGIAPEYDGLLLALAADLGERLLAAFKTPSGLPGGHVHLQKVCGGSTMHRAAGVIRGGM